MSQACREGPAFAMPSLLSPNVQAIAFPAPNPQCDRAPDGLAAGTPRKLRNDLIARLGAERVLSRPIDLIRFATDASPYRLFPKVVVIAHDVDDVRKADKIGGPAENALG